MTARVGKKVDLDITAGYNPLRFPAVSNEYCFNFFDFDGTLFPTAGFEAIHILEPNSSGRGIFYSDLFKGVIVVISNNVYKITPDHSVRLFSLQTLSGRVFFAENALTTLPNAATGDPGGQLVISDGANVYIFALDGTLVRATNDVGTTLGFLPGMIAFLDARFVCNALNTNQIRGSELNDARTFPLDQLGIIDGQTRGIITFKTMFFVFGKDTTTIFHDSNGFPFPFTPDTTRSFQYGALSPASISVGMDRFCWVGASRFSTPVILSSSGGQPQIISTDAIDASLDELTLPENSVGFLYQLDNHTFYQVNFLSDGLSLLYDFNTRKWYRVSDKNLKGHPIQGVAVYEEGNEVLAISSQDGNVHKFSLQLYTNNGNIVPRLLNTKNYTQDERPLVCTELDIQMEEGEIQEFSRVCLLVSKDRGRIYRASQIKEVGPIGDRTALLRFYNLGSARWWTFKLEFYSINRVVVMNASAFFL